MELSKNQRIRLNQLIEHIKDEDKSNATSILESIMLSNETHDPYYNLLVMPVCAYVLHRKQPKDLLEMISFTNKLIKFGNENRDEVSRAVLIYGTDRSITGEDHLARMFIKLAKEFMETI